MGEVIGSRFFNIFLQVEWIFRLTPNYKKQKKCLKVLHEFTDSVIIARRDELLKQEAYPKENVDTESTERRLVLLDVLLQSTIDDKPLSNREIREEVDTFIFAGHDTTTSGVAFCLYNLAKHPEVQDKVYREIKSIFGDDTDKPIKQTDLAKLNYLDLVIKESLRMYPPVPLYGRETQEDIILSKIILITCVSQLRQILFNFFLKTRSSSQRKPN